MTLDLTETCLSLEHGGGISTMFGGTSDIVEYAVGEMDLSNERSCFTVEVYKQGGILCKISVQSVTSLCQTFRGDHR